MNDIKNGSQIASLIKEINHLVNQYLRVALKDSGITPPQIMVIGLLWENKRMSVSEISKEMHLANSTVSGIIDRLENQDFVRRVRSEEDKRIVYVELSEQSNEFHTQFKNTVSNYFGDMISGASRDEINDILKGLNTLKDLLTK